MIFKLTALVLTACVLIGSSNVLEVKAAEATATASVAYGNECIAVQNEVLELIDEIDSEYLDKHFKFKVLDPAIGTTLILTKDGDWTGYSLDSVEGSGNHLNFLSSTKFFKDCEYYIETLSNSKCEKTYKEGENYFNYVDCRPLAFELKGDKKEIVDMLNKTGNAVIPADAYVYFNVHTTAYEKKELLNKDDLYENCIISSMKVIKRPITVWVTKYDSDVFKANIDGATPVAEDSLS